MYIILVMLFLYFQHLVRLLYSVQMCYQLLIYPNLL